MRILFFSDYYSTWDIGGATRVLQEQLRGLDKDPEIDVELISGYPGDEEKEASQHSWLRVPYKCRFFLFKLF